LQNAAFVHKRLLQWDLRTVHRDALSGGYRGIETQRLADDGFEVRERIKLLHGRRVGRASVQLDTELGLDRRLTAECEKRPGNCGATITEGRLRVKSGRKCRVHTSWFHGLQVGMSVSLGSTLSASVVFEQKTERRKRKGHSRDKISESPIRMLSGISAAIFDLISRLSRSWPCTSCFPTGTEAPDPSVLRSARTAIFLFCISSDPMRRTLSKARSRARERRVGYKKRMPIPFYFLSRMKGRGCLRWTGRLERRV